MIGNSLFLDTNIIIYLLLGDKTIAEILQGKSIYISFITELELLSFQDLTVDETKKIKSLLSEMVVLDINHEIKELAITFNKKYKLKLPDCIIASTAYYLNMPIFTSDKDFEQIEELNILLYQPQ